MNLAALPPLIAAGESQTMEFKSSFDKACIATLVAFANAQGGTVLVGVSDEGASGGASDLLSYIQAHPGQRSNEMVVALNTPLRSIERWLKQLKENGLIEFTGATKSGGYHAAAAKPAQP